MFTLYSHWNGLKLWPDMSFLNNYFKFTLEWFEAVDILEGRGVPHPLDGLPGCHDPHVLHGDDCVQKQLEALPVVGGREPRQGVRV